jgi:hypothetical protein
MARSSRATTAFARDAAGLIMNPRHLLPILAVVFLVLGGYRLLKNGGTLDPRSRSWLLTGGLFAAVSAWLFWKG